MITKPAFLNGSWLLGSLCLWLFCAGVAQQPGSAKKTLSETATNAITRPGSTTGVVQLDPESGLAMDKSLTLVKGNCLACHSGKLIQQSHFDREKWVERIRWMQRTQKLWDLGESEPAIVTYLTTYYGPLKTSFDGRRLPLVTPVWYKQTGY